MVAFRILSLASVQAVFLQVIFFHAVFSISAHAKLALIYDGPGTCAEGCARAVERPAKTAGLDVRFVQPAEINASLLSQAALWIQPGGDAITVATILSDFQKRELREFVSNGGGYVGFCAGAFFADHKVDDALTIDGLGLIPGEANDYHVDPRLQILPIQWHGKTRHIYFEDGPYFVMNTNDPSHMVGSYPNGALASVSFPYGRGRVALSGPHPEAPSDWKKKAHLYDPDGSDVDLAIQMIRWAIGSK